MDSSQFYTQMQSEHRITMASAHATKQIIKLLWLLILLAGYSSVALAKVKNIKPLAIAGSDQSVFTGATVFLDGSQSTDSDGSIKKWQWTQSKGTKVKLSNANTAKASFTSPTLKAKIISSTLAFKLTVTDDKKASASITVQIKISAIPVCVLPQVLEHNDCISPSKICVKPQVLQYGECVTPPPLCTHQQILQNGICVNLKDACPSPQVFLNGMCINLVETCQSPKVLKKGICTTPPVVCNLPLVLQNGVCVGASLSAAFNDTGIIECSDGINNIDGCGIAQFPNQDAEVGRDARNYNDSDGQAGFSFTKISAAGKELPLNASQWTCIKDNVTGLLWENKTNNGSLHDKNRSFSFYNQAFNPKGEYGTDTDVSGFINTVNNEVLCGLTNWRLPSNEELQGIANYGFPLPGPAIDQNFFSNTTNTAFWTSSPFPRDINGAWILYFDDGRVFDDYRNREGGSSARLVSGNSTPHTYTISADGQEVTDNATGLIWQRCIQGMYWSGLTCIGSPNGHMFQESLQLAENVRNTTGTNWRLPNLKELASLVDTSRTGIALDETVFPNSPHDQYWSSSPFSNDAFFAWVVHFFHGSVYYTYTEDLGMVRLVRDKN